MRNGDSHLAVRANEGHFDTGSSNRKSKVIMIDISYKFYLEKLPGIYIPVVCKWYFITASGAVHDNLNLTITSTI